MQPKKFSEYTPITETDGSEVIPILKAGVNATVKSEDLPISTATQTAIDAADADIAAHVADVANPHQVTKTQVGLGNADNTSDANKPVSTAQATAIALKADQSTTYTKTEVDTKDTAVADTAQTNLTAHTSNTSNPHATTKAQVGLANADNTSDVDKPISTATQTALDAKATNTALDAHTNNTSNPHSVTKAQVGLGNADNTSDIDKPVSTAQAAADATKLSKASNLSDLASIPTAKTNLGINNVDNTSDMNKPVSTAQAAALDGKVNKAGDEMTAALAIKYGLSAGTTTPLVLQNSASAAGTSTQLRFANDANVGGYGAGIIKTTRISDGSADMDFILSKGAGATATALSIDGSDMSLSIGPVKYISGNGFPNGVVSAPVGSKYIDTAATNGALEWMKASGTGNTGWVVSVGDTGWRNIDYSEIIDGWASGIGSSKLRIRRVGNMVQCVMVRFSLNGAAATSNNFYVVTSGFRPSINGNNLGLGALVAGAAVPYLGILEYGAISNVLASDKKDYISFNVSWLTNEAWPTTLPGTA